MKKLTTLLAVMAMVFGLSGKAQAVPMYYTFEGTVIVADDFVGAIANAGLSVGSAVTYTFIVDFDADGFRTLNDGTVDTLVDYASANFFYTDYVSGDALVQVDGGYYNGAGSMAEYNFGYDQITPFGLHEGYLIGNSDDDSLRVNSGDAFVSDWVEGTVVSSYSYTFDSTGNSSYIETGLTLTSISPVNAVPEPSTLLLLGSGLIGLGFFRRKSALRLGSEQAIA